MTLPDLVLWIGVGIAGMSAVLLVRRTAWKAIGAYKLRLAGPRPLRASHHRLWREPGPVERLTLVHGPGGADAAPVAPFTFLEEHDTGSQPCLSVRDARGRRWRIKWGHEARVEAFAVRLAWACGYFAEITHFVPSGVILQLQDLKRTRDCVEAADGRFIDARFEADDPEVRKFFEEHSWSWDDNPFLGTRELSGLKIVMMLLSNWDAKDRRDVARGSNTAIFEQRVGRWPRVHREARYLLTDWGGAMGRWGSNIVTRGRWDVDGFEAQTPQFVTGVKNGRVSFGYTGQHTADIAGDIPVEHARWFHGYASRITEPQLVEGLLASGATDDEATRFARALVERIRQLGRFTASAAESPSDERT
jgi:hypothetical protein